MRARSIIRKDTSELINLVTLSEFIRFSLPSLVSKSPTSIPFLRAQTSSYTQQHTNNVTLEGATQYFSRCMHLDEIRHNESSVEFSIAAINKTLRHELTATNAVFQWHWSDIFSIFKLEKFFDSASDLQVSVINDPAEIASSEKLLPCV